MWDYKLLQNELMQREIKFDCGLSNQEIMEIEKIYEIRFPFEYSEFLKVGIPVSAGFYNWRDLTQKNVNYIKERMNIPFMDILDCYDEIDEWPSSWGIKPETSQDLKEKIKSLLQEAPRLIPIYKHRYIAMVEKSSPIFSVMGLDIVYYGENLFQYFEIEFGIKKYSEIEFNDIEYIKFWSDTINW